MKSERVILLILLTLAGIAGAVVVVLSVWFIREVLPYIGLMLAIGGTPLATWVLLIRAGYPANMERRK